MPAESETTFRCTSGALCEFELDPVARTMSVVWRGQGPPTAADILEFNEYVAAEAMRAEGTDVIDIQNEDLGGMTREEYGRAREVMAERMAAFGAGNFRPCPGCGCPIVYPARSCMGCALANA